MFIHAKGQVRMVDTPLVARNVQNPFPFLALEPVKNWYSRKLSVKLICCSQEHASPHPLFVSTFQLEQDQIFKTRHSHSKQWLAAVHIATKLFALWNLAIFPANDFHFTMQQNRKSVNSCSDIDSLCSTQISTFPLCSGCDSPAVCWWNDSLFHQNTYFYESSGLLIGVNEQSAQNWFLNPLYDFREMI